MKYIKLFENYISKETRLFKDMLAQFNYYALDDDKTIEKQAIYQKVLELYKNVPTFNNSKILNSDNSLKLVYHASYNKFNTFKTPAFFGSVDAYTNNETIDYCCVLNIENPLELRGNILGHDKFVDLIADIFKEQDNLGELIEMAKKYSDGYGFFKYIESNNMVYKWHIVYDYINENGYDGAILWESDPSITYYFDGYIVMKPEQIKILFTTDK